MRAAEPVSVPSSSIQQQYMYTRSFGFVWACFMFNMYYHHLLSLAAQHHHSLLLLAAACPSEQMPSPGHSLRGCRCARTAKQCQQTVQAWSAPSRTARCTSRTRHQWHVLRQWATQ
jgi:hypothetical protein